MGIDSSSPAIARNLRSLAVLQIAREIYRKLHCSSNYASAKATNKTHPPLFSCCASQPRHPFGNLPPNQQGAPPDSTCIRRQRSSPPYLTSNVPLCAQGGTLPAVPPMPHQPPAVNFLAIGGFAAIVPPPPVAALPLLQRPMCLTVLGDRSN